MILRLIVILGLLLGSRGASADLHADFDDLLTGYVTEGGVRYAAWAASQNDRERLSSYVDTLESVSPDTMETDDALAYWINLYNAATLELVLSHYPVGSIKETVGLLESPWRKEVVTVEGEELSLNQIENEIIRKEYEDARIHFALNCASVSCPPLQNGAYRGKNLDTQLDAACRRTLNDQRWVNTEDDRLVLTRIFDWYKKDFEKDAGSVVAFITRYREDGEQLTERKIEYADYDWRLNEAP